MRARGFYKAAAAVQTLLLLASLVLPGTISADTPPSISAQLAAGVVTVTGANWGAADSVDLVTTDPTGAQVNQASVEASATGSLTYVFNLESPVEGTYHVSASTSSGASASAAFDGPAADPTDPPVIDPTDPPAPDPTDPPVVDPTAPPAPAPTASYVVMFDAGTSGAAQAAAIAAAGAIDEGSVPQLRLHVVSATASAIADLIADPSVNRIDVDRSRAVEADPSDPGYAGQWALPVIGWDDVFGTVDPSGSAVVALLDTGVDAGHPDLAGQLVAGTSILDGASSTSDPNGHGTWMAGIIAALTDNGTDIAGVGFDGVKVMPVTVLGADGTGQDSDIIAGIVWATDNGADVINMSFSNPGYSAALQAAIDYAWASNVVVVAATGNDATSSVTFPAGDRGVIGVSATNSSDELASWSNYGQAVFLAAPGVDISTTTPGGGTTSITGTSASSAIVAAAAALLRAADASASNGVIAHRLAANADAAGTAAETGNGRLNLARAIADDSTASVQPAGAAPVGGGGPLVGPYTIASVTVNTATTLNGSTGQITVAAGASITMVMSVTTTGSGTLNDWNMSAWKISTVAPTNASDGTLTCVNTPDESGAGTYTESITITAPASSGTYHLYLYAYNGSSCSTGSGPSALFTRSNAVVVKTATTTAITSDSPDPSVVGQSYSVGVSVTRASGSSTPTGTVTVSDGTITSPACTLAGSGATTTATCTLASTTAGAKTLVATYAGDANFGGSTSAGVAHTVNKANTTTTITNAAELGTSTVAGDPYDVDFSVAVTAPGAGTPTGNVTVSDGTGQTCVGTVAAGTCSLTSTTAGTKTITATYTPGDANFNASAASAGVSHTVTPAPPEISTANIQGQTTVSGFPGTAWTLSNVIGPVTWGSTGWLVSTTAPTSAAQLAECTNASFTGSGPYTDQITVVAPSTGGQYNAYFVAYSGLGCTGLESDVFTLPNAVFVTLGSWSIGSINLPEGNSGTSTLDIPVTFTRGGTATGPVSIQFTTGGGTATAGPCGTGSNDYVATSGTINSSTPGYSDTTSFSVTVPVTICGDAVFETDQTFNVTLSSPTASTGGGVGVGTIVNDDAAPPDVTSIAPNSRAADTTGDHTVGGTGFQDGATVLFSGTGITVNTVTFNGATSLTVNITVSLAAASGTRTITVTNPDTQTDTSGSIFTVVGSKTWDGSVSSAWNVNDNWTPSGVPTNLDDVTIPGTGTAPTQPTLSDDRSVRSLTIDPGATLTTASGDNDLSATTTIVVHGTIVRIGTGDLSATGGVTFGAGSTYRHNQNSGTIPTASWNANSTVEITGWTNSSTSPGGLGQAFGNFTWNSTSQTANLSFAGDFSAGENSSVAGTLTIASTGTGSIRLLNSGASPTLNVGAYDQTGGIFAIFGSGSTNTSTLNVLGNFEIANGTLRVSEGSSNTPTAILNVAGDFIQTGGTITRLDNNGTASVNFDGTSPQAFSKSGGTISDVINFTILSGATVNFGTSVLNGSSGTFTANNGATMGIGHVQGISTTAATGQIQVSGTKTYNTGVNYLYNGASAQVVGNGLPAGTITGSVRIDNAAGVSLSAADKTISGSLVLTDGALITGANNVIMSGSGSVSRTDGFVQGNLRKPVAAGNPTLAFEVGTGSTYAPISVSITGAAAGGTLTGSSTTGLHSSYATSGLSQTKYVNRWWGLASSGFGLTSYDATFNFAAADLVGSPDTSILLVRKFNGPSTWTAPASSSSTATSATATSFTSFSDFAVGQSPIQAQTISVTTNAPASAAYGSSFNVAATASSSLPVSITTSGGCSGSGAGAAAVTMTSSTVSCVIHYNQSGDVNFSPAPEVTETTSATKATLSVNADPKTKVYGDPDPALTATLSGFAFLEDASSAGVTGNGSCSRAVGDDVGSYTITCGIGDLAAANYDFVAGATANLAITQATLIVTPDAGQTKVYGQPDPTFTFSASGFVNGDLPAILVGDLGRAASQNVGLHAFNVGTLTAGPNYLISVAPESFEITPATLTVTPDGGQTKVYGDIDPVLTFTAAGYQFSDDASVFTGGLYRELGEDVDSYEIGAGDLAASNYAISFTTGVDFEITARAITVTVDAGQGKTYGAIDPALAFAISTGSLAFADAFTGGLVRDAGENVGLYPINQGTLAIDDGNGGANYELTFVGDDFEITARAITVTVDAGQGKTYGAIDPALTFAISTGSLAFADAFTGGLVRDAGENVGLYPINQGTLAIDDGNGGANYELTFVGDDFEITVATLVVTPDPDQSKTYGAANPVYTYAATGFENGDDESIFTGVLSRIAGENVGLYEIIVSSLSAGSNYAISFTTGVDFEITARAITVTVDAGQGKTYGAIDPALTFAISTGSLAFADAFTGGLVRDAGENVGLYPINQGTLAIDDGNGGANYELTFVGDDFEITARAITVTVDAGQGKTYGAIDPALTFAISTGSLAFADAFTGGLVRDAGENVGLYPINQGTLAIDDGNGGANYELTFVGDDFEITVATLVVTPDPDQSKTYGAANPVYTYAATGFENGDDESIFTGVLSRIAGENVGLYEIIVSSLSAGSNYAISFTTGVDFEITARAITVTVDAGQGKTYGAIDPALTFAISTGSLAFADAFTGGLVRDAGENVGLYPINQGTLAIDDGNGGANYELTFVGDDFEITARAITVTVDAGQGKTYGAIDPALTFAISTGSLAFADAFTGGLVRDAGENVGLYPINQGTLAIDDGNGGANYELTFVGDDFEITARAITVTVDAGQGKTYGAIDPALTFAISTGSLAFADAFTGGLVRDAGENVGLYPINQGTLAIDDGNGGANYELTFVGDDFEITVATLVVTPDPDQSKTYGAANPVYTYAATGFENGDDESIFTGVLSRIAGENVGLYEIIVSSLSAGSNYAISFTTGVDFEITARAITVTVDAGQGKTYGAIDPALTFAISTGSLAFADAFTGGLVRDAGENVGLYPINQGTLAIDDGNGGANYELTFVGDDFEITARAITVTVDAGQGKTYGAIDPALTFAISTGSLAFADAFTGGLVRDAGENVGLYPINQGTLAIDDGNGGANYELTFVGDDFEITVATLLVNADTKTKVYGAADPALTYTLTGFQFSDTAATSDITGTGSCIRVAGEDVGSYAITCSVDDLAAPNYEFAVGASANLAITVATVTVTPDAGQSKVYGDADPVLTWTTDGLVNGDTDSIFTGLLSRISGEDAGLYVITLGTLSAGDNYDTVLDVTTVTFAITAAGSIVTVVCPAGPYTYSGSAQEPCLATWASTGADAEGGSLLVTYTDNTNAGTATAAAEFTGDANHAGSTGEATFVIDPATSTVSVICPVSAEYTGSAIEPCTASWLSDGADAEGGSLPVSYTDNTNVGTATASAEFGGDANHTGDTGTATFAITAAGSIVTVVCPAGPYTYSGSAQEPCLATWASTGADAEGGSLLVTYTDNTNAGTATAAAEFTGDANHAGSTGEATFVIDPATSTVSVICPVSAEYTGSAIEPCTASWLSDGADAEGGSLPVSYTDNTNVGTATASAEFGGDANHTGDTGTATFAITAAGSIVTVVCPAGPYTYSGSAQEPCLATWASTGADAEGGSLLVTYTDNTNAGTATAAAEFTGDANHAGSTGEATFVIDPATSTVSVICPVSAEYTGSAIEPCTASWLSDGADAEGGSLPVSYTDNTNVGTATASAEFGGDANHTGDTGTATFAITAAGSIVTVVCPAGPYTYSGSAQEPCLATWASTGADAEGGSLLVTYTDNTNAGTATAAAEFTGDANHAGSTGEATFVIDPATSTVSVICPVSAEYTGSAIEPCTASWLSDGADAEGGSLPVSYTDNTNVGTATASAEFGGDANHTGDTGTATFAITAAGSIVTVVCPAGPYTYSGSAQEPCLATWASTGADAEGGSLLVTYTDNTNAGTATAAAEFTGDANHAGSTGEATFVIDPATSTVSVICPVSAEYTGSAIEPCTASWLSDGADAEGGSLPVSYTDNTNVGTATASAEFGGDANHTGDTGTATFAITAAGSIVTVVCPAGPYTYSGSAQEPCLATWASTGADAEGGSLLVTYTDNTNAGTATAAAEFTGDANHAGSTGEATFVIDPATSTVSVICPVSAEYTGSAIEPCTASWLSDGADAEGGSLPVSYTDNTNVGTATASAEFGGDANHTGDTGTATFAITAAGSIVTVVCPAGPYTYSGSAQEPCLATWASTGADAEGGSLLVTYTDNTNAGTATAAAEFTGDANHAGSTGEATFVIDPATSTVSVICPVSAEYTGSAIEPCTASWLSDGADAEGGSLPVSYTDNTNVGTATASAEFGGDANHTGDTGTATFAITAAGSIVTVVCPAGPYTYSGSAQEPCLATWASTGADAEGGSLLVTYTDNTNAGTATAAAEFTGDANHAGSTGEATFVIDPATSTVSVICPVSAEYTGSAIEPCTASWLSDGADAEGGSLPVSYTDNTNVGTATASAEFGGDANHTGDTGTATFAITAAGSIVTVVCPAGPYTYSGSAQEPCLATWASTGADAEGGSLLVTYTDNTNAGTATAAAEFTGDANHAGSTGEATFVIDPATSTVSVICPVSAEYTGSAIEPCTASWLSDGADAEGGSLPVSYTDNTNVGTATASAEFGGDANHTGDTGTATFAITAAGSIVTVVCPAGPYTYSGSAQEPCLATWASTGADAEGGSLLVTYTDNTNAGTATAAAEFTGDANHAGSTGEATFVIDPATSTVSVICPVSAEYTGSAIEPCTASWLSDGADAEGGSLPVSYTDNTNVGTATASAEFGGDANHTGDTGTATFAITAAGSIVTVVCPAGQAYTGSAIIPCTVAITGAGGLSLTPDPTYTDNVNVGTATASYNFGGDANHTGSAGSDTFEITPVGTTVTVVCPAGPYTYSGLAQEPCSATWASNGTDGAGGPLTVTYTNNTNAGTATANAAYAGDPNHTGDTGSATFVIGEAAAVCTVTGYSVTYDALPHTATGSCLGLGGDTLAGLNLAGTTATNAGTYANRPWSFHDAAGNYADQSGTVDNSIAKKALSVNAVAASKVYGMDDPTFTWTFSGFAGSNNAGNSGITGSAACTRTPGNTVAGSPYTITCAPGTLLAPNYSFVTGSTALFTITKANQTITFPALPNKDYSDPPFTVYGTASSELPVTFTSLTPSVCTTTGTNGTTVTLVGSGTCTIRADQAWQRQLQPGRAGDAQLHGRRRRQADDDGGAQLHQPVAVQPDDHLRRGRALEHDDRDPDGHGHLQGRRNGPRDPTARPRRHDVLDLDPDGRQPHDHRDLQPDGHVGDLVRLDGPGRQGSNHDDQPHEQQEPVEPGPERQVHGDGDEPLRHADRHDHLPPRVHGPRHGHPQRAGQGHVHHEQPATRQPDHHRHVQPEHTDVPDVERLPGPARAVAAQVEGQIERRVRTGPALLIPGRRISAMGGDEGRRALAQGPRSARQTGSGRLRSRGAAGPSRRRGRSPRTWPRAAGRRRRAASGDGTSRG